MNYLYDDNYCTTNMLSFILKNENLKSYVINFDKNLLYCYDKEIKDIHYYDSFQNYLSNEKLKNCLPGIQNIKQGISVYYQYYSKQDENKYGICAIIFE